MQEIILRQNLKEKCKYFPCHNLDKEIFDCRTCYCPFYEICNKKQNAAFGGYLLKNAVWACENCTYIHRKDAVEKIINLREQNKSLAEIYDILSVDILCQDEV